MPDVNLVFHVHQPRRLCKNFNGKKIYDDGLNKIVFDRCASKCYMPTNSILLENIEKRKSFKVAFSLSGIFLEQCERFNRDVLDGFKQLCETGNVEVLSETYYHSLSSLYKDEGEFLEQVKEHRQIIRDLLSSKALGKVFRNTELIYDNRIAERISKLGFKGVITEGIEHLLHGRNPNELYSDPLNKVRILLRNYRLSDDIGYRFSSRWWEEWPLTAEKFAHWLNVTPGSIITLYMDYETFGEHHWPESRIFDFLKALPWFVDREPNTTFSLPTEAIRKHKPVGVLDVQWAVSWADLERDVSAWLRNNMQVECFERLQSFYPKILNSNNKSLICLWRNFQTSDNLYYMCDKWWLEGDIHKYFSHFSTPAEAYTNFRSMLDFLQKNLKY